MFQMLQCPCSAAINIPLLVLWAMLCVFFRDSARYGYAATVAAFTPMVLFLGVIKGDIQGAWTRIESTFFGVLVYLLIDNLMYPMYSDVKIRVGVVEGLKETKEVLFHSLEAMKFLIDSKKIKNALERYEVNLYDIFPESLEHIELITKHYKLLEDNEVRQKKALQEVEYDPSFFRNPFPKSCYEDLYQSFQQLLRSISTMKNSILSLRKTMIDIITNKNKNRRKLNNSNEVEVVIQQTSLDYQDFFHQIEDIEKLQNLLKVVYDNHTLQVLDLAIFELESFFQRHHRLVNLIYLTVLSTHIDEIMNQVDQQFIQYFANTERIKTSMNESSHKIGDDQKISINFDPQFLLARQDIFESLCELMKDISIVGIELLKVKNIETL